MATTEHAPETARRAWFAPSIRGYQRVWLRGDVLAGLAAGTVVIPQAMAYATIAELPVEVGLYTCMAPMVVYALLGAARALSVSTTSTIAVLVATTLAGLPDVDQRSTDDVLAAAFTLTLMVGLCLLVMRLLRLGSLVEIISPATLTGIRVGVGLTVLATQLPALLGIPASDGSGFFEKVADAVRDLLDADPATLLVSVVAVGSMLALRHWAPTVPGPLLVVAGGILLVATTGIEDDGSGQGLALIDPVPTGLPTPSLPVLHDVPDLLPGALAIAIMAFLETVLVARTNRRRGEPQIDVDQELVATGAAAIAGGLTQTLPPAGGFSQSAVNLRSGARTQLAQLVTAGLAVLVALLLAPLLDDLPRAVLAAMVLVAILGLLDPREFRLYAQVDRAEFWVAIVVAAIGLTGGMLAGVAVGVALTLALVVRGVSRPRAVPLLPRRGGGWTTNPAEAASPAPQQPDVLLLRLEGSLYAGNARVTVDDILERFHAADGLRGVVVEGSAVRQPTVPLLDGLRDLRDELRGDGAELALAAFPEAAVARCRRVDWFADHEARGLVTPSVEDAIRRVDPASSPEVGEDVR